MEVKKSRLETEKALERILEKPCTQCGEPNYCPEGYEHCCAECPLQSECYDIYDANPKDCGYAVCPKKREQHD